MLDEAAQVIAEGGDPRGVVRSEADNDFRDMVVVTGEITNGDTKEEYCARYTESLDLFRPQESSSG